MFLQAQHFCFLDLSKEKLCSILVFGNVRYNKVARINHDNVASRGAVGRTHTVVRLETRIRRKDGTEISGVPYMCWMDFHNGILSCGFLCARLISFSFPATTPRVTTPHLYCTGYHAQGYHAFTTTARLPRLCIYLVRISRLPRHSS